MNAFFLLLIGSFIVVSGCAPTVTIPRDSFQFKGDVPPMVLSRDAVSGKLDNLSEGETLVVAVAADGSGALSQPTIAKVNVVETILAREGSSEDACKRGMGLCDQDGDGVWDSDCREFLSPKCEIEDFVSFQSWYKISKDAGDFGGSMVKNSERIDIAEEDRRQVPFHLKMLTINFGNKTFTGDLTIHSQLPPQVTFTKINDVTKVWDRQAIQTAIMFIPGIGPSLGLAMDRYGATESDAEFTTDYAEEDKRIKVVAKNITLEPGEGISLEYTVNYAIRN